MTSQIQPQPQQQKKIRRYELCELEDDDYVPTIKQWKCKECDLLMCDECFQNRRIHECILDQDE